MILALRATLGLVALINAITGLQAAVAPRAFFDDFPLGHGWVAALPPFNEHLITDVGGFYLAFAVLFGWAAARPERPLVLPLAVGWAGLRAHPSHVARDPPRPLRRRRRARADDRPRRRPRPVRPGRRGVWR